jgi:hypothetical protein
MCVNKYFLNNLSGRSFRYLLPPLGPVIERDMILPSLPVVAVVVIRGESDGPNNRGGAHGARLRMGFAVVARRTGGPFTVAHPARFKANTRSAKPPIARRSIVNLCSLLAAWLAWELECRHKAKSIGFY